ncbi:acylneuraminate cytidylyltransferase [Blastopirellula marina]|uniref:N-acylneuraminate cytidylyltransferase n=1 Tax=Blastopirellula marina DSM 3645 TaxID=314230 RepID=A3ZPD8_9BACT|nr:acylneuraminate cytidylyltransferase [Blastopirellula marina]EAQ81616.1 putative transferase [Blastopirellula marina DSM 3645]
MNNTTPSTWAIIPARGGSVTIPRKNLISIAGKPLIVWTIEAARSAATVERVIVTTDDGEIADVSRKAGAEVVVRPEALSGPDASSESALMHVLETYLADGKSLPDSIAFLQCTSPLTRAEDIDGTVGALYRDKADTALAVVPFHYFLWKKGASADAEGVNHDKSARLLRQQREQEYLEAGAVYVMRTKGFLERRFRFFGKTAMYEMPIRRRWEIDESDDIPIVEALLAVDASRLAESAGRVRRFPRVQDVDAVVFDFDGVFTDNKVHVNADGTETVVCNRADGLGLGLLRETGVPLLVLSKERNTIASVRCKKLDIPCQLGIDDKLTFLKAWVEERGFALQRIVYVGNDVNDVECLDAVGYGAIVADAEAALFSEGRYVLRRAGGEGAVREVCDFLLRQDA